MQQATAILSGIALVGIIALTSLMMFVPVPPANHDFIVAALSSLATALTIGGSMHAATKVMGNGAVDTGTTDQ